MGGLRQTRSMPRPSIVSDAFSRTDRRRLLRALRTTTAARVYRRVAAVLAVAEGRSVADSARQFRVARSTVHRWVADYLVTRDPGGLADGERTGRPPSGDISARELAAILGRDPRTLGYRATTWTVGLLACYCAEHLDRPITARTLRRRLHQHGYRWKRPRYTYSERASHLAQKKGLSAVA
jgi:transposase